MMQFPENFLWGAATSAYQVEGNNLNSDWWQWERSAGKEPSGAACRHYEFYEQDFDLAKGLNHNAHRLSIEWSRIEPEEGKFIDRELRHYLDVVLSLRARNIEPIVTLHHFTNPFWLSKKGGWQNKETVNCFLRFCAMVVRCLAKHVHYWITINEPTIYISHAYIFGAWPPQARSYLKAKRVQGHMALAHIRAFRLIHKIYQELAIQKPAVSIAQYTQAFVPCRQNFRDRFASALRNKWYNFGFLDKIARHNALDFIGVNYYSRQLVELKGCWLGNLFWDICEKNHHPVKKNSLGWDIYPAGLLEVLLNLKKYRLPVIVTENGIATLDDNLRREYLSAHLRSIYLAIEKGVKVGGYLYWSLLDNFEWDKGFAPRFGLIEVDYQTYKRRIRESARLFAQTCKTGILQE